MEYVAAALQAVLLVGAASSISYAAIRRIMEGSTIQVTEAGIGVMLFSMVVSILLSRYLFRVAKKAGSAALEANAHNITGDIFSTAGVMVGLTLVRITGKTIIDPILAILVAFMILRMAFLVIRMAFRGLLDARLPKEEEDQIIATIKEHTNLLAGFHEIRTRMSGNLRFIDFHLMLPKNASVEDAHNMCDHLEADLKNRLPNCNVTIHVEPCDVECVKCGISSCSMRINIQTT